MVKKFQDASIVSRRPEESASSARRVVAPPAAEPKSPEADLLDKLRIAMRAEEAKHTPKARVPKGRLIGLGYEGTTPPSIDYKNYNDVIKMLLAKK